MKSKQTIKTHDPREFVRGLQQIMISDSKRIGFLFGAGTSMAVKRGASKESVVPGVQEMTKIVISKIGEDNFKKALRQIEEELSVSDIGSRSNTYCRALYKRNRSLVKKHCAA